ncbi:hypothetical protein [Marinicellulosiphila megalodicopiae]|uniref:hypothetical protein n=1 Tax=Marinicellulosiphila megalodicopiae TaxID=2724896 RepID=UPI003BAF7820
MAKRWSKLKKEIESLFEPELRLDLHCVDVNRSIDAKNGNSGEGLSMLSLGNYFVNLNQETIWNFPKDFKEPSFEKWPDGNPWKYSVSEINLLVRDYIDTPKDKLLNQEFEEDLFGLTKILLAADRRISMNKLQDYFKQNPNECGLKVLNQRASNKSSNTDAASSAGS